VIFRRIMDWRIWIRFVIEGFVEPTVLYRKYMLVLKLCCTILCYYNITKSLVEVIYTSTLKLAMPYFHNLLYGQNLVNLVK
jgi:hypothetical protein